MSGPFLPKEPQNSSATEETQVRAPSQETGQKETGLKETWQRRTAGQPPSAKAAEQQGLTPIPARIGTVDIEQFSHNLARLVEESGRALAAYLKPR